MARVLDWTWSGRQFCPLRRSGGTGRRAGFRSQWVQARGGSSPPFGTTEGRRGTVKQRHPEPARILLPRASKPRWNILGRFTPSAMTYGCVGSTFRRSAVVPLRPSTSPSPLFHPAGSRRPPRGQASHLGETGAAEDFERLHRPRAFVAVGHDLRYDHPSLRNVIGEAAPAGMRRAPCRCARSPIRAALSMSIYDERVPLLGSAPARNSSHHFLAATGRRAHLRITPRSRSARGSSGWSPQIGLSGSFRSLSSRKRKLQKRAQTAPAGRPAKSPAPIIQLIVSSAWNAADDPGGYTQPPALAAAGHQSRRWRLWRGGSDNKALPARRRPGLAPLSGKMLP